MAMVFVTFEYAMIAMFSLSVVFMINKTISYIIEIADLMDKNDGLIIDNNGLIIDNERLIIDNERLTKRNEILIEAFKLISE